MAYKDDRPLDEKLRTLVGKPEEEAVEWWRLRLEQIADIPRPSARAGALLPEMRELATLPEAQRLALTRARVLAALKLPQDALEKIFEARRLAAQQAPEVETADDAFLFEHVVPTLPAEIQERMRRAARAAT